MASQERIPVSSTSCWIPPKFFWKGGPSHCLCPVTSSSSSSARVRVQSARWTYWNTPCAASKSTWARRFRPTTSACSMKTLSLSPSRVQILAHTSPSFPISMSMTGLLMRNSPAQILLTRWRITTGAATQTGSTRARPNSWHPLSSAIEPDVRSALPIPPARMLATSQNWSVWT